MKRFLFILLSMILLISCEGGIKYENIFIHENGELKDAHRYVLKVPAAGGETEIEVVSYGVRALRHMSGEKFVTVDNIPYPPLEDERYENNPDFYCQKIKLQIQENGGKISRKEKMLFICDHYNGFRAEITIRQKGK